MEPVQEWAWYKTAFQMKEYWLVNWNPVVGLRGLDIESEVDKAVWELLNHPSNNKDIPLRYLLNPEPKTDISNKVH